LSGAWFGWKLMENDEASTCPVDEALNPLLAV
jgi:hypothetical protein